MPVKLWVERYRGQPPVAELACLIEASGTLGRAPGNDLVLDDPGKYISRSHARVELREGGYYLTDTGSNPSVVNERLLGHGRETLLQAGDQVVIGDYQIGVALLVVEEVDPDQTGIGATQTLAVFVPPTPVQAPEPPPLEVPAPARSEPGFSQPQVDTDALAAASILQGESVFEAAPMLDDPLGLDLFAGQRPTAAFLGTPADHLSPELQAMPVTASPAPQALDGARIPDGYDALADLLAAPAVPTSPVPVAAPVPTPAPPVAAEPAAPGAQEAVFQALLDGLGLPQLRSSRSPEALARLVGEMLRAATGGTMGVLMTRALTKRESHIEMTMIGTHSNNPLKFFPDPTSALSQMLSTDAPAYLPGVQALHAAFDDLRAHEMAVIAGMREALGEVMQRFDPARIERLSAPGALERLLPSARKARLWARFAELHSELARDGDEELQRLYGEKFSLAYQQQVSRLRDAP